MTPPLRSVLLVALVMCAAVATATDACGSPVTVSATYKMSLCPGAVINVSNPACWDPAGVPPSTAAVGLESSPGRSLMYLSAQVLRFASVVVPAGSSVTLQSAAWEVTTCLQVQGTLGIMAASGYVEDPTYLADASVPQGTDCKTVPLGFTSRVCGPGALYVAHGGTVFASGLYASLWTRSTIAGTLTMSDGSFLWGNTTIVSGGVLTAGIMYFHGELQIESGATATIAQLRVDKWGAAQAASNPQLVIANQGTLTFALRAPARLAYEYNWDMISTYDSSNIDVVILLLNQGSMSFLASPTNLVEVQAQPCAGLNMNIVNHGIVTWSGMQQFFTGTGTTINYGEIVASNGTVYLSDYASHGGTTNTTNGGYFHFGNGAGPDTKTMLTCDRDRVTLHTAKGEKPEIDGAETLIVPKKSKGNNCSIDNDCYPDQCCVNGVCVINCTIDNGCFENECCVNGVCEPAQCYMSYGWDACCGCCGGGPNGPCQSSSHGPYCGGSMFSWEVDQECVDGVEFVDRLQLDKMRARFEHLVESLPQFGRNRYMFEGPASRIVGDGTGGVMFNEPLEIRRGSKIVVGSGGVLRNLIDGNVSPFVTDKKRGGKATVEVEAGGEFGAGIKSVYDSSVKLIVREAGTLYVSQYSQVRLSKHHNIVLEPHAKLVVNGRIVADSTTKEPLLLMGKNSANTPTSGKL